MYFGHQSFIIHVFCKYLLPVSSLYNSFSTVFHRVEVFNFNKVQLVNFLFHELGFWCYNLKNHHQTKSHVFSLTWSSSFTILHFTLRSTIHFVVISMKGVGSLCLDFFFFFFWQVGISLFQYHLLKRLLNYFCTFVKNQLTVFVWVYLWINLLLWSICCLFFHQYHTVYITISSQ